MTKSKTTFLAMVFVLGSLAYMAATVTSVASALGAISKPASKTAPMIILVRSRDDIFGRRQSRRERVRRDRPRRERVRRDRPRREHVRRDRSRRDRSHVNRSRRNLFGKKYTRRDRKHKRRHYRSSRHHYYKRHRHRRRGFLHFYSGYWYAYPWWLYANPAPRYYEYDSVHVDWCLAQFKSYNPRTNQYLGYDGFYHRCISPYS